MNKLSKILLGIIILLVIALGIMIYLYFGMKTAAENNYNNFISKSEEASRLYEKIDELENNNNLDGDFLFSEEGQ